jgi:hypothetical protein
MADDRITWFRGKRRPGPRQTIGVLELQSDGRCRAVFAERAEVEGRCHVLLARGAWGPKTSLDTRWWSLVLGKDHKAHTVRNGSCGDAITTADVPRVIRALEELDLLSEQTMIAVDDGPAVFPRLQAAKRLGRSGGVDSAPAVPESR